jgi:hypothetical protein
MDFATEMGFASARPDLYASTFVSNATFIDLVLVELLTGPMTNVDHGLGVEAG